MPHTKTATEAVVVLANLMDQSGQLNDESAARLALAAKLWHEAPGAVLITTGWDYRPDSSIKIAHAFREEAARAHAIPISSIVADINARDTVGDAVFVKRNVVEKSAIRNLTVVSSDYHMARVREIFEFIFGPQFSLRFAGAAAEIHDTIEDSEARSVAAFRTTFSGIAPGDSQAIYERLVKAHPFYNGLVHPAVVEVAS